MNDPLILFRAVHIAATVLSSGTVAFLLLVAEPAARRVSDISIGGLRRRLNVMIWSALAVAAIAEAGWLVWLSADIYGAPVIVAMFLAELGLALVSRFVPQLQVFFLAMPIKSALALLVLVLYGATLFDMARDSISDLKSTVPTLDTHWGSSGAPR